MIRVGKRDFPWREGMTVSDLLRDLGDPYPYPIVRIEGRTVTRPYFDETLIPDNSEVFLIPTVAGG
jgi:sulfur carrier protein ThiS